MPDAAGAGPPQQLLWPPPDPGWGLVGAGFEVWASGLTIRVGLVSVSVTHGAPERERERLANGSQEAAGAGRAGTEQTILER